MEKEKENESDSLPWLLKVLVNITHQEGKKNGKKNGRKNFSEGKLNRKRILDAGFQTVLVEILKVKFQEISKILNIQSDKCNFWALRVLRNCCADQTSKYESQGKKVLKI
jgi:hypothetical protein